MAEDRDPPLPSTLRHLPSAICLLPSAFSMPRKPFLLRIDDQVLASIQHWAGDEMRSLNGQIEYLLRDALRRSGRLSKRPTNAGTGGASAEDDAAVHESEPEQE